MSKPSATLKWEMAAREAVEALRLTNDHTFPLVPWGIRVEDRRPIPEMEDRPALLILTQCPKCGDPYVFVISEKDTSDVTHTCKKCR